MRAETRPFEEGDLAGAGRLLAERHRRHRVSSPLLSASYEDPETATAEVAAVWKSVDASGAVAVHEGRVVAFLLGAPKQSAVWGPNIWVEPAGQAVSGAVEAEVMRDLYALAATRWVDEGRTAQYVLVPSSDTALVTAWFRLGFGHQQTHALRQPLSAAQPQPPGLTIRAARREDIPVLARLEIELPRHQGLSPCFSSGPLPTLEEAVTELDDDFDNPDFATYVAEHDAAVIGSAVGCSLALSSPNHSLMRPDSAGFLGFAAVLPEARGLGAGRTLGEAVLTWAGREGYDCVATDWRQTNLLSSRAWPALGFEGTFWRLHRTIGY